MKPLYEGKAKQLFATDDPQLLRVQYKDSATAFNGEKKATLSGKGELNNRITSLFFEYLREHGVENHFVKRLSATEQLVKRVEIIPLEVVVRNWAAGSLANRLGLTEGTPFSQPIVEFYYKDDELGDPLVTEDHIQLLDIATPEQLIEMRQISLRVNQLLIQWMDERGITLVDFKLEFGIDADQKLLLADEISPDTCRFWDKASGEKMDKDRFRRDLGRVIEAYEEILTRLGGRADV
ncbi:phosphoribosylaminoimidazole-succinocarboxamide synthase [Seinonella peptonophila]|uniref:Phosphoribosylaminoimidazole-succinocarboxamide synthase n=1 Tax=Seinonella peptonophila TaxID=112248 RepID=A0A1M4ZH15_9BACL|nr:phosphoribosylaminoimidazolesuccinocarboxamide synthase [Seinonella peptonophila]SHF17248.1 phosphoribosylaminoimidazole-succinocarboxamide synthase [Seinonella peptonophila]